MNASYVATFGRQLSWIAHTFRHSSRLDNTSCDIYSVGIILWEIFARASPYEGENYKEVIRAVCNRRINKRPRIPLEAPPKFADLMKKCWSPDAHFARKLEIWT